jgi:hypothetical protein
MFNQDSRTGVPISLSNLIGSVLEDFIDAIEPGEWPARPIRIQRRISERGLFLVKRRRMNSK